MQTIELGSAALLGAVLDRSENSTAASARSKTASTVAPQISAADDATLSETGSHLATAAASTGDVRSDKVAALKAAIDNGSYNVPAADVADKLIGAMLG